MLPDYKGYEIDSKLNISSINTSETINDSYNGQNQNFQPEIEAFVDDYHELDSLNINESKDGTSISIGSSIRKVFKKQNERKNDGFLELGLMFTFGSYDYNHSTYRHFDSLTNTFDGSTSADDIYQNLITQNLVSDIGTEDESGYNLYAKFNIPLVLDAI